MYVTPLNFRYADAMEEPGTDKSKIHDKKISRESLVVRRKRAHESRPPSEHRESKSIRLIMAQEIQDGLEEVDVEEVEVTERGKMVEKKLKGLAPGKNAKYFSSILH